MRNVANFSFSDSDEELSFEEIIRNKPSQFADTIVGTAPEILMAAIAQIDGNAKFAERYWPKLEQWADYLLANRPT